MFARLFAESGLSLDRLKALLAVGAAGSIVKAAAGDPVKQSQYSRQIKELEDFFRIKLVERHGKGIRLTISGKELARISRFFLLGLSNFQRGCLAEEQTFRIGASATFIHSFLLPVLSSARALQSHTRFVVESATDDEIERGLHDLTLDFGVTTRTAISRPLQMKPLGGWRLKLWVPRARFSNAKSAARAFKERKLPLVLAGKELGPIMDALNSQEPRVICDSYLDAVVAMQCEELASVLPEFLVPDAKPETFMAVRIPALDSRRFYFGLAWNPRLLRLNPHAIRRRDFLMETLGARMRG
jgi:LysR family transcriptional regulator, nitrogen assimilation regulatory protein